MIPISRDNAILLSNRRLHADSDRLLAIVEVAESPYQLSLVERVGGDLHPPHRRHVSKEGHELLGRGLDGSRRRVAFVAGEGDAGLDSDGGGVVGGEMAAEGLGDDGEGGGSGERF